MQVKPAVRILAFLASILSAGSAAADFELAILFPVPKTVVVPEDVEPSVLTALSGVRDLTIEIAMSGNMMRDVLVDHLNGDLARANKRIVLSGEVNPIHVKQLRRIRRLEVVYSLGPDGMSDKTFNALFALGPVRKYIRLPADAPAAALERICKLKFYVPVVEVGQDPLPDRLIAWLEQKRQRNNYFVLDAAVDPARIYDLVRFDPLHLEIQTHANRIPEKLFKVIKDLRGVEVVLRVDGRLSLADVKRFAALERFGIRVDLGDPARYTPGLFRMLNRIAPPR